MARAAGARFAKAVGVMLARAAGARLAKTAGDRLAREDDEGIMLASIPEALRGMPLLTMPARKLAAALLASVLAAAHLLSTCSQTRFRPLMACQMGDVMPSTLAKSITLRHGRHMHGANTQTSG